MYNKSNVPNPSSSWGAMPILAKSHWLFDELTKEKLRSLKTLSEYHLGKFSLVFYRPFDGHVDRGSPPISSWLVKRVVDLKVESDFLRVTDFVPAFFPNLVSISILKKDRGGDFNDIKPLLLSGGASVRSLNIAALPVNRADLVELGIKYPRLLELGIHQNGPLGEGTWGHFPSLQKLLIGSELVEHQLSAIISNCRSLRSISIIHSDSLIEQLKQSPSSETIYKVTIVSMSKSLTDDEYRWLKYRFPKLTIVYLCKEDFFTHVADLYQYTIKHHSQRLEIEGGRCGVGASHEKFYLDPLDP